MLKKYPLFFIPVRNGILGSILGMVLFVALFYLNRNPLFIPVILDFRILLFGVLIFFSLKEYRNFYQKGLLSFWEGMIMSFVLTIAFAITSFAAIWLLGVLDPEFALNYIALKTAQMKLYTASDITQIGKPQFDLFLSTLPATRPFDLAMMYLRQTFVLSFFISMILSLILRRQPKT